MDRNPKPMEISFATAKEMPGAQVVSEAFELLMTLRREIMSLAVDEVIDTRFAGPDFSDETAGPGKISVRIPCFVRIPDLDRLAQAIYRCRNRIGSLLSIPPEQIRHEICLMAEQESYK